MTYGIKRGRCSGNCSDSLKQTAKPFRSLSVQKIVEQLKDDESLRFAIESASLFSVIKNGPQRAILCPFTAEIHKRLAGRRRIGLLKNSLLRCRRRRVRLQPWEQCI